MTSLSELIDQRRRLRERRAVWEAICQILQEDYLPRDEREPKKLIVPDGENPSQAVSAESLEQVLREIESGPLIQLTYEIHRIEEEPLDKLLLAPTLGSSTSEAP
jgi:hypothetical protein